MQYTNTIISVRELVMGYTNNDEEGVTGYDGRLDIRPPYQREFVYKDDQRDAVIRTIMEGAPLSLMYWVDNGNDTFEVLDGQQRTISVCEYVRGAFSIEFESGLPKYFHGLTDEEQERILNYSLMVCICNGDHKERLNWFRRINIAGERLTDQELLNINYTGTWLSDAKRLFSKTNCWAYKLGAKFLKGSPIRQEYLETAIKWISKGNIADYMASHQQDPNANELKMYYLNVIEWVKTTFGEKNYRKEMCGIEWGFLYNQYKDNNYDANALEVRVKELMENEEVTDKKGIYEFVLSNEDERLAKKLSKRTFDKREMRTKYEQQGGICPCCGKHFEIEEMEGDHIVPWWKGGLTRFDNLQMLCKTCNREKGGK